MTRFAPPGSVHSASYETWLSKAIARDLEAAGFSRDVAPTPLTAEELPGCAAEPLRSSREIAAVLGVSVERVRQIELGAMAKIRRRYTADLEPRLKPRRSQSA